MTRTPAARWNRRGTIFIAAMWVLIALVGLVLVMSRWARVESKASANRLAEAQAAMAERAGEQYVLYQVASTGADATFTSQAIPAQVPVGDGFFWVTRPDREGDRLQDFGVDDEGGRININTASSTMLLMLPGMTPDVAAAIVDWRDQDDNPQPYGAESDYYGSLPSPYRAKNAPFETVEELLLVKGVTPELLYGMDANHNGFLDEEELAAGGTGASFNAGNDTSRGWLPFLSTTGPGNAAQGQQQLTNVNGNNLQPVLDVLRGALDANRATEVGNRIPGGRPFRNMVDFYVKSGMKAEEFALVADKLTVQGGAANNARVNVNTAPREVLRCLTGLEDSDAATLVAARENGADTTNVAWVADAIDKTKAVNIGDQITSRSYRYSADVLGVSGDGRAFRRVRIYVDATQATPTIVYRRDLTDVGWSIGWDVRQQLRSGAGIEMGSAVMASRR
jgi:DNA uptake protein ComE-like DNA-binding protein